MHRVFRLDLSNRTMQKLTEEQHAADQRYQNGTLNVEAEWKRARRNKPLREAFTVLRVMAGERERCMYCSDSYGTDIDHFWPKSRYPQYMFRWSNLLLCCSECNEIKGSKFHLENGEPTLIDPSVDEPWEFLDFDPDTGNIVARYNPDTNTYMIKGQKTVEILQLDSRQAMARGYWRTFRRIKNKLEEALELGRLEVTVLVQELSEADDHGLLGWCFHGTGALLPPFADLRTGHPDTWEACRAALF